MKLNKIMKASMSLIAAMGYLALAAGSANAALITVGDGLSFTASSSLTGDYLPAKANAGNGLTTNQHGTASRTGWLSGSGGTVTPGGADTTTANHWIQFDLGDVYNLSSVQVWNYNHSSYTVSGINQLDIYFMGDTPYIDHGALEVQRHSHRQFLRIPSFAEVLKSTPFVGTWDDHDYGLNDSDGLFPKKNNSIKSFKEYRPQYGYGDNKGNGIYTKVRTGPVEVFVIDARWFSCTGKPQIDPKQKTLLGKAQWQWLKKELKASTAAFKILACGIIWDDKQNQEKDGWETYSAERKALLGWIRIEKISGVSLLGGDIHVSRLLKYPDKHVGYPLYQFISSPMHGSTIKSLNVEHPDLKWSALEKNTLMLIDIDHESKDPTLKASFMNKNGQAIHSVEMTLSQLTPYRFS